MLDMEEIKKEIQSLEECNKTSYDVCKKLAILYTVKNNYMKDNPSKVNDVSTKTI